MISAVWLPVAALSGVALATLVAYFGRRNLAAELSSARGLLALAEQRLTDQREQYEARLREATLSDERMRTQLEALLPRVADSVLAAKTDQLHQAARSDFQLIEQQTVTKVAENNSRLAVLMDEMKQRIESYQLRLSEIDCERARAATRIEQQVREVLTAGQNLAAEARTLREALRTSHGVRGRWGEAVLKNILDICGLTENIDYHLQPSFATDDAQLRPDAIVRLPSGRDLVIDSKASLAGFLEAADESDDERCRLKLRDFAAVLRRRADELASREYSRNLVNSVPCVVMFVPSEAAFRAALDADAELFRYGQEKRPAVLLASPTTLFPLISVIAHGWQQHMVEKQSQQLAIEVTRFAEALKVFFSHVQRIGRSIEGAGKAYDEALASFRRRISPKIDRLAELSADFRQFEELPAIEQRPTLAADYDNSVAELPNSAVAAGGH